MLGHLIQKEILDHISSLRFLILAALGGLTIWLSLFSGFTYYQARLDDYRSAQAATEERVRQIMTADEIDLSESWMEVSSVSYQVHKAPTPVCIFVRGLAPSLGRSIPIQGRSRRLKLSPTAAEPILGFFPALDLGLVVQVVLGLFVLLLTYDAVCGEKEAGTLRLTASFPVPRDRLLLGKLFGALIPTLAAFGLPLLLGAAVVLLMPEVQFTDSELARLGIVLGVFGLYLTALICAGLFASSLTHRPATSFVILLAFWVGTVVVLPRISLIVADGIRPAPSVHEHQAERFRIGREGNEARRGAIQKWTDKNPEWWGSPESREAYAHVFNNARSVGDEVRRPQFARLDEAFRNRYRSRLDLAVVLARFSPSFAVQNATVRLSGTGLERQQRFERACIRHSAENLAWYRSTKHGEYLKWANPAKYGEVKWDVSDMPRFAFQETWPEEEVRSALTDMGVLALWGILFFVGAYVALLRYDLR